MNHKIYPCLWFDGDAEEAAHFYCSVFKSSTILQNNPLVCSFSLQGTKFMALNGGPQYHKNMSVSFFVYCENEDETDRLYHALKEGGQVLMPLKKYDWSNRYAWIVDKYGVNWQLDVYDIQNDQKIIPSLLFSGDKKSMVKNAITNYSEIFPNSRILLEAPNTAGDSLPQGSLIFA